MVFPINRLVRKNLPEGEKILKKDLHFGKRRGMLSKLSGVRARELNISGCGEVWYRA